MTAKLTTQPKRRGAAAVEFAMFFPLMLSMVMGMIELGIAFNGSQKIIASIQHGGRLASSDWTANPTTNENLNQQIITDVQSFLTMNGLPGHLATVTITHANGNDAGNKFDLSDADNQLELFRIDVWLDYQSLSLFPNSFFGDGALHDSVVFRAGRTRQSK